MAWKKRKELLRALAEGLAKAGAVQFGTFTLPDGTESSYYVNLRTVSSYPGLYRLAVEALASLATKLPKYDALCSTPSTGMPFAAPLAVSLSKPLLQAKAGRGSTGKVIEGEVWPGWKVVLVNDLATSGRTLLATAKAVEQEGGEVKHALVLLDRMEGSRARLSKEGITLHSVTDMMEFADVLHSMDLITDDNMRSVTKSVEGRQ
jgi:orotate phosphoribosyltransferase